MSVDSICTGCPYAPTYEEYCNGFIDCPDAYTDKAVHCGRNQKGVTHMTNEEAFVAKEKKDEG